MKAHVHHSCVCSGAAAAGSQKADKLSLLQWVVAFQRYALAAACAPIDGATGGCVWEYESAMAHMDVVLKVSHIFVTLNVAYLNGLHLPDCRGRQKHKEAGMARHHLRPHSAEVVVRADRCQRSQHCKIIIHCER